MKVISVGGNFRVEGVRGASSEEAVDVVVRDLSED
jgi:hypothetical protein